MKPSANRPPTVPVARLAGPAVRLAGPGACLAGPVACLAVLVACLVVLAACGGPSAETDPLAPAPRDPDAAPPPPPAPVEVWRRLISDDGGVARIPLTPAAVGTRAVFVVYPGELLALATASGDHLWSLSLPAPLAAGPAVAGEALALPLDAVEGDARFPALWWVSAASGAVLESVPLPRPATALAPLGDDLLVLDSMELRRLARPSRTVWATEVEGVTAMRPAPAGTSVYLSGPGWVDAVDAATGEQRWRRQLRRPEDADEPIRLTRVAVGDERIFVAGTHERLVALGARRGNELWRRDLGTDVVAAPAVTRDVVWVAPLDAGLHAFDADNGTLLQRQDLSARTYVDLTTLGPWAVVGPRYGPWVRVRPALEEADERGPVRGTLAEGDGLRLQPTAGPAGLALINGDGTVILVRLPAPADAAAGDPSRDGVSR